MKKVILIYWKDAVGSDGWVEQDKVEKTTLPVIRTVGFLVRETEEFLTVTMADDEENDNYGAYLLIPKVNVVRRKFIKI